MAVCASAAEPSAAKPNVIWILLDACRAQNLSCYGYGRPTSPNMERLAQRGVLFERNFSQSARTNTSVPSFMTGRYFPLHCLGWRFSGASVARTPAPGEMLFPAIMKENGYRTAMFAACPLFHPADRLWKAFDEVEFWGRGPKGFPQRFEAVNTKLLGWLERQGAQPFFLYVHAFDTHFPHEMLPPYDQWLDPAYPVDQLEKLWYGQRYRRRDDKPFTAADREYFRALYDGGILDADTQIGLLLKKLDDLHLADNTYVVIGADHGQVLGEDGRTVAHEPSCDEDLHVPLLLAGPGLPAGRRIAMLTENTDIVPTLSDLLHLKTDATYDGVSLTPWLHGDNPKPAHDYIFSKPYCFADRYDSPGLFVLQTPEEKFEYDLQSRVSNLWQVPDLAAGHVDIRGRHPERIALLETRMLEERMTLYKKYLSLPVEAVVADAALLAREAQPPDAVVDTYFLSGKGEPEELCTDNKWAYTEGKLWCCGAKELCPPLTVSLSAPNGRYTARVAVLNNSSLKGEPASALRVTLNGAATPRQVVADDLPPDQARFQMIELGECEVKNGAVRLVFEQGDHRHWAALSAFVMVPVRPDGAAGAPAPHWLEPETPGDRKDAEEVMKSLGYL